MTSLSVEEQTLQRRGARSLAQELSTFFTKEQLVTTQYDQTGANFTLISSNGLAGDDLYNVVKEYFPHAQGEIAAKSVTINYSELVKDAQKYQSGLDAITNIKSKADFGAAIIKQALEDVYSTLKFHSGTKSTTTYFNDSGERRAGVSAVIADGNIESMKVAINNYKGINDKIIGKIGELLEAAGLPKDVISYKPAIMSENANELQKQYNVITSQIKSNGKFDGIKVDFESQFTINKDFEITPAQIKKVQEITGGKSPNAEAVTVASVIGLKGLNKSLNDVEFLASALKEHCKQEGYPACKTYISNDRQGNNTKVNIDIPQEYLDKVPPSFAFTSKSEQLSVQLIRGFGEKHLGKIKDTKGENKIDAYGAHLHLNAPLTESDKDIISRAANKSFSLAV